MRNIGCAISALRFQVVATIALALLGAGAWAQGVGRVQFVSGPVEVERGAQRLVLQPNSEVREGDLVRTGADAHLQVLMVDGAFLSMRPATQVRIERYEFNRTTAGAGEALIALLTGTLRTFTGEIVNRDRSRFRMKTSIASVGIRGSGNILAHLEDTGTLNHTLTGAHSTTSLDEQGVEQTVVSYPGQTVQVRRGQAPRFIPTPSFIMAAASPPMKSESAARQPATPAAADATAAPVAAAERSATTAPASAERDSATTTATSSAAPGSTAATTPTSTDSTARSTTPASSSVSVTTSQATSAAVGASIVTVQTAVRAASQAEIRFFSPLSTGGYEGVIGQSLDGTSVAYDTAGRLVQFDGLLGTFLAGPGSLPPGYRESTYEGAISFRGGTHRDSFRSPDSSVVLGRWEGGSVSVADSSAPGGVATFALGPRSVSYDVTVPTHSGRLGSFTGTANYSLAGATTPSDSFGNTGSVTSASVSANFSARTVSGNFGLAINGQSFSLAGISDLTPGSPRFSFASSLQNLDINCTGNCSSLGYLGTMNGQFAGLTGEWMSVSYRVNPNRGANGGYSDFVVGNLALNASSSPTVGIVLPQSGVANLAWTGVDPGRSVINFPQAVGPPSISGTLQANFSTQTAGFNATVSCGSSCSSPTYVASAGNVPIVGAGFSATTDTQRPAGIGSMSVACSGSGCGSAGTATGRFDALFTNSAGTTGIANLSVGDSAGGYDVAATFGPANSSVARIAAADAEKAAARIASPNGTMAGAAVPARLGDRRIGRAGRIQ